MKRPGFVGTFVRPAMLGFAAALALPCLAVAQASSPTLEPVATRIVPVAQLGELLKRSPGDVMVQFTSPDPNCGYCVRANANLPLRLATEAWPGPLIRVQWSPWRAFPAELATLPLKTPLKGIPTIVVFHDGIESGRIEGDDGWTSAAKPAAAAAAAPAAAAPPAQAAAAAPAQAEAPGPARIEPGNVRDFWGRTIALRTAGFAPDAGPAQPTTWRSSDSAVASVDANGRLQLLRRGRATITATRAGVNVTMQVEVIGFVALGETNAKHTCAIPDDRRAIYCWGDAATKIPTSRGFVTRFPAPVRISAGQMPEDVRIAGVQSSSFASCALTEDGRVFCFGDAYGPIGVGRQPPSPKPHAEPPVEIAAEAGAPQRFVALGVGPRYACAASAEGQLYCWGGPTAAMPVAKERSAGQPFLKAVSMQRGDVPMAAHITQIALSVNGGCVLADGQAYCWPSNGQNRPTRVESGELPAGQRLTRIKSDDFSCALTAAGSAYCRGAAQGPRFGNGNASFQTGRAWVAAAPASSGPVRYQALSLGGIAASTCAVGVDGAAYCWGRSYLGSAADGNAEVHDLLRPTPTRRGEIPADVKLQDLVCGEYHCAALGDDGRIYTWGSNGMSALGREEAGLAKSATPVLVRAPLAD